MCIRDRCYDGTAVTRVDADAYIPTLTIARAPNGGGEEYENANLISPKYREQFLGTAEDKTCLLYTSRCV